MTTTADHFVKMKAALPKDSRNGLADRAAAIDEDEPVWAIVRLDHDETRRRSRDGALTHVLAVSHIEPLTSEAQLDDLVAWAERQAAERRQLTGQMPLPTERDELLAELRELADELADTTVEDLEASYAGRYDGLLPSGDPDAVLHLREFLAERRADLRLPGRPVDDRPLPGDDSDVVHTTETTP